MMGRAGRPQYDDSAVACIFVQEEKKNFFKKFLYEPFPVESCLHSQITDHFNAEICSGGLTKKEDCIDYLTWTYFFRRLVKNPIYYNLEDASANSINSYLTDLVNQSLQELEDNDCIAVDHHNNSITTRPLGKIASFYYLSFKSVFYFQKHLLPSDTVDHLLYILSQAREFSELPVRHNEENLNESLAKLCRYQCPDKVFDSPHVKTFLLALAHFDRLPLPITDYITDTKSVLDNSMRVLQGMIDICANIGYLDTTLSMISLCQMIVQGQWTNGTPMINIPNLELDVIYQLYQKGIKTLPHLIARVDEVEKLLPTFDSSFKRRDVIEKTLLAIRRIPIVQVKFQILPVNPQSGKYTKGEPLQPGGLGVVKVYLERINHHYSMRAAFTKFPKPKDLVWWLVIGDKDRNSILALKKINLRHKLKVSLKVQLPLKLTSDKRLSLFLVNDSYLSLDQEYDIFLDRNQGKTSRASNVRPSGDESSETSSSFAQTFEELDLEDYDNPYL